MVVAQRKAQLIKGKHGGLSFIPRTHIKEHACGQEVGGGEYAYSFSFGEVKTGRFLRIADQSASLELSVNPKF